LIEKVDRVEWLSRLSLLFYFAPIDQPELGQNLEYEFTFSFLVGLCLKKYLSKRHPTSLEIKKL
jgi:hypothetical protein